MSTGIENPTPEDAPDGEYMAVFIPIRLPELSRSGPPLLPGLMAASVWITSWIGRPVAAELISLRSPLKKEEAIFRSSKMRIKLEILGQKMAFVLNFLYWHVSFAFASMDEMCRIYSSQEKRPSMKMHTHQELASMGYIEW